MKRNLLLATTCLLSATALAEDINTLPKDTTKVIDIEEVVVIASPKETGKLRELPNAVSLISQKDMQANQITTLKNVSALVPNFFMPDYGSKITSAVYIRGIGSRINTPAVGLYVDNIPYIDKSAFDFNFYDIERIDILRGPQGTLYGRNTMGGLIKVHTRSPFSYQGTDVKLSYGSKSNYRSASLTHYHRWNEHFAFSAGGYYEGSDGFFRNAYNGKKIDNMEAGGGRIRAIWLPSDNLKLDFTIGYDYSDEGGYPYYYTGALNKSKEEYKEHIGKISYNRDCGYRRGLFNTGLNIEYQGNSFIMNAVTGYQNLTDRMYLDQDFLPVDIYNIEQKQRINTLSEEITFKSKKNQRWIWVTGASGFYQWLHTDAPVTFQSEGIQWLENNINKGMASSGMPINLKILSETMPVPGIFDTPVLGAAIFHQSTFNHLLFENLSATVGLRLDYEKNKIDYNSSAAMNIQMYMAGKPMGKPMEQAAEFIGKLDDDHVQLLPKFALKYDFNKQNNIYATVSRGFRSGGYNIQMFSELLQSALKQRPGAGSAVSDDEIKNLVTYKPEYSWNYEIGSHLSLFGGKLKTDLAAFYMDTRDQQIAKFVESGLGRMMVNAGSSESYGAEVSLTASVNRNLSLNGSYGYTHSTFKKYDAGKSSSDENIDYSGHYVPFVPRHTMNVGANYSFFLGGNKWAQSLTVGLNYTGAGKIYWTEKNDVSQSFYGTLNGRISLQAKALQIDFWGRNLTNKDYTTFYFESMERGFEQRSKPLQLGVDVRYHF
ncbi:TonB-dependent receptor [uncultured Phocaeicola sp.]|mgnify:FL=1|jgi:outer membrane receptor protein involved in Fe transport|uniref:TonB-dependent receptor n=1 Tax=uncultured Phocaeicola sp. TaxID=990718 RepID=UPI00259066F9|nr:TonB-dependent receptor [uncultured Phocaeicola sp.]